MKFLVSQKIKCIGLFLSLFFAIEKGYSEESVSQQSSQDVVAQFHTMILHSHEASLEGSPPPKEEGVHFIGIEVPGSIKAQGVFKEDLQRRFLNQDLTMGHFEEIRCQILVYYKEKGSSLVEVFIPPQDITEGILCVIVSESTLGEVRTKGNEWSSATFTRKTLQVKPGEKINAQDILADLSYLNQNPFKRTDVIFSPGKKGGTTDIELVTQEQHPTRVYAGIDNRGNDAIGNHRQYEGFNCGNFLGLDHVFSYQFTTALPVSRMHAHAAHYKIPLPRRMSLGFYGGYSKIHTKKFDKYFRNSGENVQFSSRYHLPMFGWNMASNDFSIGFDYKRSNNNLLFSEDPVVAKMATLTQLVIGYQYQPLLDSGWGNFDIQLYLSPIRWLTNQIKSDYQLLSPKAIPQYFYLTFGWERTFTLPHNMNIYVRFQGQYANQNLLPSEQLGLGGYDTVRGYKEREINGEQGVLANLEWRSPYFSLFKFKALSNASCECNNRVKDALRFLAFLDYGFTQRHVAIHGSKDSQYIVGVGPGMQYVIDPYLNLTVYWGFRLKTTDVSTSLGGRVNFNLVASF